MENFPFPLEPDEVIHVASDGTAFLHLDTETCPVEERFQLRKTMTRTEYLKQVVSKFPIIAHRGTFEGTWFLQHLGVTPRIYHDTKLCAYLKDENEPSGLKYQAVKLLGVEPWDEEQDFQNPDQKILLPYNARDSKYGHRLYREHDLPFLRKNPKIAKLMRYILLPATEVVIEMICNGFHIDEIAATQKLKKCEEEMSRINGEIDAIAGYHLNPGSPKQLVGFLYKELKLKCHIKTEKGNPSTGEAALIRLKGKHKATDLILEWRKWQKYKGTYLVPWLKKGPVLHATYDNTGTDTGRYSSSMVKDKRGEKKLGAVLHQCPRDTFIRNLVVPRGGVPVYPGGYVKDPHPEDWCMVSGDLSQIQLRLVAQASNDPTMISVFNSLICKTCGFQVPIKGPFKIGDPCGNKNCDGILEEGDIHYTTARSLKPVGEIDKETRKKAKAVNFGFVFGMWAKKFKAYALENYDVKLTDQESEEYREAFFHRYSMLEPWHRRVEAFVSRTGWIGSLFGAIRHLPDAKYGAPVEEWRQREAVRQAINSPIQRAEVDFISLIMALIGSYSLKWDFKIDRKRCFFIGTSHDSILSECHKTYAQELKEGILWTVANLPLHWFDIEMKVPVRMDVSLYEREWEGKELETYHA